MHELSLSSAIVETVLRYAEGRRVSVVTTGSARCARSCPSSLALLLRDRRPRHRLSRTPSSSWSWFHALLRCPYCEREWDPAPTPALEAQLMPTLSLPDLRRGGRRDVAGNEFEVESIEVEQPEPSEHPLLS